MCGIAGFVNLNFQAPDQNLLKRMTDAIAYRGPDDQGQEINQGAALGNRRLAVIDISHNGHMPMWDKKKRYCITYNGEIYNYQALRKGLAAQGYSFRSDSDTEVILNLFAEYGVNCFIKLRGMFAIAIWDSKEQKLYLARDQFGIKPLHYYVDNQVLVFGSEIKSILLHPNVKKILNHQALSQYFSIAFGAVPAPLTMFKDIYKLKPAHYAILDKHKLHISSYWQTNTIDINQITEQEAIAQGTSLIEKSVQEQLVSDVPLGTFLSGGVDSSLISAIAQKYTKHSINTFSIGFEDPQFDESQYALQVAKHLNSKHHHQVFTVKQLLDVLPQVLDKLDEPLADASILPTYLLSQFTRQKVTVALSGDGGDELFLGYPTYIAHKLGFSLNTFPTWTNSCLHQVALFSHSLLEKLPFVKHSPNFSFKFKLNRFFAGLSRDPAVQYLNFLGPINLNQKNNLILNHQESALPLLHQTLQKQNKNSMLSQIQLWDFIYYLGEDCLVKTDRASSYNSLEVRPPFLNLELAKFALSLPIKLKLKHFNLKYLLKKIAQPYLPQNIINRPKKGFGLPIHHWLNNELKGEMHNLLNQNKLSKQEIFDFSFVEQLINEHENNISDHRMVLWNLMMFQWWWDRWMK